MFLNIGRVAARWSLWPRRFRHVAVYMFMPIFDLPFVSTNEFCIWSPHTPANPVGDTDEINSFKAFLVDRKGLESLEKLVYPDYSSLEHPTREPR